MNAPPIREDDALVDGYAGRKVLVTGGLGFLGSAVVHKLVSIGAHVRVLDSLLPHCGGSPTNLAGIESTVEIMVEDLRNRDAANRAARGCQIIFHLAAPAGPATMPNDLYTEMDIMCIGTIHLLEATRVFAPGARIVIASSHHVYGNQRVLPVKEDAPTMPETLFGVHKLATENYALAYQRSHGVDVAVARLATVFGPRQRLHGASLGTVAHAIERALYDESISLWGAESRLQDFLHVDMAVEALLCLGLLAKCDRSPVNVGTGRGTSMLTMAEAVVRLVGRGRIESTPRGNGIPAPRVIPEFVADLNRLRALGVDLRHAALETTLRDTIGQMRSQRVAA